MEIYSSGNGELRMLVTSVGILVVDIIAADLPKISDPGELTFTGRSIELHIGGHAANVSIDLRKLGLKREEVSLVGAIGNDIFGDYIKTILEKHGVKSHLQRVQATGTSKDLILVVKGEDRRYHVDVGANWHLSFDHVISILNEEKPLIFYGGGIGFMGKIDEELPSILQRAKELGCLTFVDPVAPYKHGWDIIIPSLGFVDVFHCNNLEATKITREKDPKKAGMNLLSRGVKFVIISLGGKGLIAMTKKTMFKMPAFKVPVIDPTGAGDAFCAGVIRSLLRLSDQKPFEVDKLSKEELVHVLLEGEAAGAACVTMVGTTTAVTKDKVDKLLEEQGSKILRKTQLENFNCNS